MSLDEATIQKKDGTKKPKKEVALRPCTDIIAAEDCDLGYEEEVDNNDILYSRVRLLQGLSPEVIKDKMPVGTFIDSITKEELPQKFIVVKIAKKNFIRFNPKKADDYGFDSAFEPGKIIYRTDDKNDPRLKADLEFGPNNESPKTTAFLNFLVLFEGQDSPLVLSFSKAAYTVGQELITHLSRAKTKQRPTFACKFDLTAEFVDGAKGQYFTPKVAPAGLSDENEYKLAKEMCVAFNALSEAGKVKFDEVTE